MQIGAALVSEKPQISTKYGIKVWREQSYGLEGWCVMIRYA